MSDSEIRKRIAKCLWEVLDDEGMTQKELSEESGVSYRTINRALYERNTIRITDLIKICRTLDISIDAMVGLYD